MLVGVEIPGLRVRCGSPLPLWQSFEACGLMGWRADRFRGSLGFFVEVSPGRWGCGDEWAHGDPLWRSILLPSLNLVGQGYVGRRRIAG